MEVGGFDAGPVAAGPCVVLVNERNQLLTPEPGRVALHGTLFQ
jgi:hypothetical protein